MCPFSPVPEGRDGGRIKNIISDFDFQKELVAAGEKLVVVNFSEP